MDPVFIIIVLNLILGFGFAIPVARLLRKVNRQPVRILHSFAILFGIYFVECIAVAAAMGIPVFSVGLAFIWGIVFGLWLRDRASTREVLKTSFFLSLYSSLPAASFIVVPAFMWAGGWQILSAQDGARFGIPESLGLPWPLNTILGFYAALVIGAVIFKTIITTGEVSLLIHLGEKSKVDNF